MTMVATALVLVLCALGTVVAGTAWRRRLEALHAEPGTACDRVSATPYASLGPIPNGALGVALYLSIAIVVLALPELLPLAILAALAAVLYGVYLTYVLVRVLHMGCRLCYTGHAINLALLVALLFV